MLIGWLLNHPKYFFIKLCEYFLCSSLEFIILICLGNFDDLVDHLHNKLSIVVFLLQPYSLVLLNGTNLLFYKLDAMLLIKGEIVGKYEIIFLILYSVNFVDFVPHSWSSPSCWCLRIIGSKILENSSNQDVSLFN
jgi:hypothetical protein